MTLVDRKTEKQKIRDKHNQYSMCTLRTVGWSDLLIFEIFQNLGHLAHLTLVDWSTEKIKIRDKHKQSVYTVYSRVE